MSDSIQESDLRLHKSAARRAWRTYPLTCSGWKILQKTLLLAVLLLLSAALRAEAMDSLQGRYGAVVRITMPDRSEEFQCVLVFSKNEATLTAVPQGNDKGVFVIHSDRSTRKGRYWIKSSSNPEAVEPWIDSFDANMTPIMTTLYDPTFPACTYLQCKESKEYLVLQDEPLQAKFRKNKKGMHVDSTFQLDQKGRVVSFRQDLANSSNQELPIRTTSLSNYDIDGLGDVPRNISTTLTIPVRYSEVTPRPTKTISATMEILSREALPKDFAMAAYLDSATKNFKEVTVDYEARARSAMPTPAPATPSISAPPTANNAAPSTLNNAAPPAANNAAKGLPTLPSYGGHKVYTHLLLAVGAVMVILGGALFLRKKAGG